ncbi:MAG: hypothetical protein ACLFUO_00240 [Candidatus Woesearchaeota archaeon]
MITEGKAKIDIDDSTLISKKLSVFYNPLMKLNRDLSIEIIKNYASKKKPLRVALPLSGSGIRGIRFLLECPKYVKHVSFNDLDKESVRKIMDNIILNKINNYELFTCFKEEAQSFLLESKGFDYIDIDPYGTPNPFLDSSCQRISRNGILAITATDTAPLSGTYPKVCMRNYDSTPLRNDLKHIIGLRILIRKVQLVGAQYEKALYPIFSYSKHHYFRIFFKAVKSKEKCNEIISDHKYLIYDKKTCGYNYSYKNCTDDKNCVVAGKMYSGNLWDKTLASKIDLIKEIPEESSFDGKYYHVHRLASLKKNSVPQFKRLISKINEKGKRACRTHFSKEMIKTDIEIDDLIELI